MIAFYFCFFAIDGYLNEEETEDVTIEFEENVDAGKNGTLKPTNASMDKV